MYTDVVAMRHPQQYSRMVPKRCLKQIRCIIRICKNLSLLLRLWRVGNSRIPLVIVVIILG
jgi:hypothetical protein